MKTSFKERFRLTEKGMCAALSIGSTIAFLGTVLVSCQPHTAPSTMASTNQAIDKSTYPEAKSGADAFVMVAKRMMGLNPGAADKQDHIGLMNLADMLGFKYAFNSCNANWVANVDQNDSVTIFAPHANSANGDCFENDASAPVHYGFANWGILANYTTELDPYTDIPGGDALPAPSAPAAGAQVMTGDAQVKIVDGRLVVITPEVISVTGSNGSTDLQNLNVNYTRTVSTTHTITLTTTQTNEVDVGLTITAAGGFAPFSTVSAALNTTYKFTLAKANAQATAQALTTAVECSSTVNQKPGCSYKMTITANYVQTKGRYIGYIRARPNQVSLGGKLNDQRDCQSKPYRNKHGTCSGQHVDETLGADNVPYGTDLKNRLSGGDGKWYWQTLPSLPSQKQADGKANIDILSDLLTNGDYDKFAIRFDDVTESITDCKATVEVVAGGDNCRTSDPVVNTGTK